MRGARPPCGSPPSLGEHTGAPRKGESPPASYRAMEGIPPSCGPRAECGDGYGRKESHDRDLPLPPMRPPAPLRPMAPSPVANPSPDSLSSIHIGSESLTRARGFSARVGVWERPDQA